MPAAQVPAAPLLYAVERHLQRAGLSLGELSRRYGDAFGESGNTLIRVLARSRHRGTIGSHIADRLEDIWGIVPTEPSSCTCTQCGAIRRQYDPAPGSLCDPCRSAA